MLFAYLHDHGFLYYLEVGGRYMTLSFHFFVLSVIGKIMKRLKKAYEEVQKITASSNAVLILILTVNAKIRYKKGLLSYCQRKKTKEQQQKVVCASAFSCNARLKLPTSFSFAKTSWVVTAVCNMNRLSSHLGYCIHPIQAFPAVLTTDST